MKNVALHLMINELLINNFIKKNIYEIYVQY